MEWKINSLDISSAFLQGNQLKRTVYVRPSTEICKEGNIWQLKRFLYGLSDAPREWYDHVCEEMKKLGGKVSLYDKSVFMWRNESNLEGLITIHVDNFEYCSKSSWHKKVINKLFQMCNISKKEKGPFKYVGLNIEQNGDEIFVNQQSYVDGLEEIEIDKERENN